MVSNMKTFSAHKNQTDVIGKTTETLLSVTSNVLVASDTMKDGSKIDVTGKK